MEPLPADIEALLDAVDPQAGPVLWLTGAGISAESGIPTFRGPQGYWRVGSRNYHPRELATRAAFGAIPDDVWSWYLYRRSVCRGAAPNAAHRALAELEERLADGFLLVTQNVDGLHLRAGNSTERTYQVHGNIDFMRCADECQPEAVPIPAGVPASWEKGRPLGEAERRLLVCPRCGARARPHVLWFDEVYDEAHFRFESSLEAAARTPLLVVVGTTGATNLPLHVGALVARRRAPMLVVNPEPNPFSEMAEQAGTGAFLQGSAGRWVPPLAARIATRLATPTADGGAPIADR
ncbi:MAG: SIR2 family NAD-dependent protein deacylase [Myxococcota bacterium]